MYRKHFFKTFGHPVAMLGEVHTNNMCCLFLRRIQKHGTIKMCCHSSTSGEPSDPVYTDKGLRKRGGDCSIDPFPLENAKLTTFTTQSSGQDLRRFFDEVGIDPAETKYWYKQFQRTTENSPDPFAVVQVDKEVFDTPEMLKSLGSCLSFLQRINLRSVVVHGLSKDQSKFTSHQRVKQELNTDTMKLVSVLESHGTPARPLFGASGVIEASIVPQHCSDTQVVRVRGEVVSWAVLSGHIPVIQSIGETSSGQLLNLDISEAAGVLAPALSPRKVILTGLECGIQDENKEVIPTVNVPTDLEWCYHMPWCTPDIRNKMQYISKLLTNLSPQSSVVVTSPSTLITELFTHHGSGTLFRNTEAIRSYKSLENIDTTRLLDVINMSFGKKLKENYLSGLLKKLNALYLSQDYNAVAIVTDEMLGSIKVPYLDKFAVSKAGQGEGLSQLLWHSICRDHPALFWRSRQDNKISSWYFKKCEGSWTSGEWTVFWYGVSSPQDSAVLTDYALNLQDSFTTSVTDYPVPET